MCWSMYASAYFSLSGCTYCWDGVEVRGGWGEAEFLSVFLNLICVPDEAPREGKVSFPEYCVGILEGNGCVGVASRGLSL
jgi:hypothetical protein